MTDEERIEKMRDALMVIRGIGCETYTRGDCFSSGRTRDAQYGADSWCDACIASDALGLPSDRTKVSAK